MPWSRKQSFTARFSVFSSARANNSSLICGLLKSLAPIGGSEDEVEAALRQLRLWGNLEATQDNAEQSSLEAFYRLRFLYALSAAGEAAERALAVFEETLSQPGELQTAALRDIRTIWKGFACCSKIHHRMRPSSTHCYSL
jgi:hypothetical protein